MVRHTLRGIYRASLPPVDIEGVVYKVVFILERPSGTVIRKVMIKRCRALIEQGELLYVIPGGSTRYQTAINGANNSLRITQHRAADADLTAFRST